MIVYIPLLLAISAFLVVWLLLRHPPEKSAAVIADTIPLLLGGFGVLLTLLGRGVIGVPLTILALSWWQRRRAVRRAPSSRKRKSTVRTTVLEMELDHDTGAMDGWVVTGHFTGARLSLLDEADLLALYAESMADGESAALLEAYLDRRFPGWRERAGQQTANGAGQTTGFAEMTKAEAYQILGLEPGASSEQIHQAWRRLMKKVHPDSGGSAFLAAKINAARDLLLS